VTATDAVVSPRSFASFVFIALILAGSVPWARAQYPENVVAAFCDADGRGERLYAEQSAPLREFIGWRFEPAWDRFVLISGYEVNPVRVAGDEAELNVRYGVEAEVTGEGVNEQPHLEVVPVNVKRVEGTWRLISKPPPPHLRANAFNRDTLFALLTAVNPSYVSNSKFVWRLFQDAGWNLPYQPASAFLGGDYFKPVAEPNVGDVVAYLDRGAPYHIGIYDGEDRVSSATVNAGVIHAALNTFPGEVRYLRLTEAARPTPVAEASHSADVGKRVEASAEAQTTPGTAQQ